VTHVDQLGPGELEQLRLQLQSVADLVTAEPGHVARSLHVRAEVEDVHQYLHVPVALLVAAVLARRQQGPATLRHEHRRKRVARTFLRR
jgi:hypothetical protein